MRIIAGRLGGRILKTVEGEGYRPAMGRTREALFSMLVARGLVWSTARVLDLFEGSGRQNLGISHGTIAAARHCKNKFCSRELCIL